MKHKPISVRQLCDLAKRSMMNTDKKAVTDSRTVAGDKRNYFKTAKVQTDLGFFEIGSIVAVKYLGVNRYGKHAFLCKLGETQMEMAESTLTDFVL